jgi:hypothetical protein
VSVPPVVERDVAARTDALLRRYAAWPRPGVPAEGAGLALLQAFAHIAGVVADRVNRVPDKNLHAFLDLIGVRPAPPLPARAPLTFALAAGATADVVVPAGTRVAAIAGAGEGEPPEFETERDVLVTAARLIAARTRDPARDRHSDHGAGAAPFGAFSASTVIDHRLYVGSDALFGIAEAADLRLRLTPVPPEARWPWMLSWQRWDGAGWVPVAGVQVGRVNQSAVDVLLTAVPAIPPSTVAGTRSRWVRARLATAIPRLGVPADTADRIRVDGLLPDALRANDAPVAPGRPFTPFVTSPRLLLRCDEAFSKQSATVGVRFELAAPGAPSSDLRIRWQWFDGGQWQPLGDSTPAQETAAGAVDDDTRCLTAGGKVTFTGPAGWKPGDDGLWLLAEVVAGSYGSSPPRVRAVTVGYEWPRPRLAPPAAGVAVARTARRLDDAFTDGAPVDLTKDFLPFGALPRPGATLYIGCDDAFAPARDSVRLDVRLTSPPDAGAGVVPPPAQGQHGLTLSWECYDAALAA